MMKVILYCKGLLCLWMSRNTAEYGPVHFLDVLHQFAAPHADCACNTVGSLMACYRDMRHIVQAYVQSIMIQVVTLPSHKD